MIQTQFEARRKTLAAQFERLGVEAFLVTALPNVRYLTGFTGSNAMLWAGPGKPVLFTDPRYGIQASQQTNCRVRITKGPLEKAVGSMLRRQSIRSLAFEADRTFCSTYDLLRNHIPRKIGIVPASGVLDNLRSVKDATEIELIRQSVNLCSKAFARAVKKIRPGISELELAGEIDHQMRRLGAEGSAFETIVAFGERTALPHAEPTNRVLNSNELILVDMGAMRSGYASDMTRMAWAGRPSRKAQKLHGAVLEAQLAALDAIRPGVTAAAIDLRARQVLKRHGLDHLFVHSTGHGLGLEIHEPPRIGRGGGTRIERGMAITVEPGVYMEGFGGIRIEDTVVVTDTGCEVLTPTPKELLVV
jgi:Xaa-Pro aminopeptidase